MDWDTQAIKLYVDDRVDYVRVYQVKPDVKRSK